MSHPSKSLEETCEIARDFLHTLETGDTATVVALQGDLGSGKTAFTQAVGRELGISESMQSPTFVIMKVYEVEYREFKKLIHIDAYRLERDEEILHLGWEEIVREPENLVFIEWPENVAGVIPENAKKVSFKFIDETTREIDI